MITAIAGVFDLLLYLLTALFPAMLYLILGPLDSGWSVFLFTFLIIYLLPRYYCIICAACSCLIPKPKPETIVKEKGGTRDYLSHNKASYHLRRIVNSYLYHPIANYKANEHPVIKHIVYWLSGAKIDPSVLIAEDVIISDPSLTEIGQGTTISSRSAVLGHIVLPTEGGLKTVIGTVKIGKNVFIGGETVIWPDVVIEDDAVILAGSRVLSGSKIRKGETWGGNPAWRVVSGKKNKQSLEKKNESGS